MNCPFKIVKLNFCISPCRPKVKGPRVTYAASSTLHLVFFSHLESKNNPSTMITLYQSCTCLTAIYILVFLTSPTFFLSIYHPRSRSHTRLASPIFALPSNCHANRHAVLYALTLSPLIIIFHPLWWCVCVCVCVCACPFLLHMHRFATHFVLQKLALTECEIKWERRRNSRGRKTDFSWSEENLRNFNNDLINKLSVRKWQFWNRFSVIIWSSVQLLLHAILKERGHVKDTLSGPEAHAII